MRRWRMMALVAAIVLIVALTLTPGSPLPYLYLAHLAEPWVDPIALAAVLNVLLFVPLGMVIAWFGRPWLLLAAVAASVTIEVVQFLLPDRNPLLSDVVTNSLGACLGYLAVVAWHRFARSRVTRQDQMQS